MGHLLSRIYRRFFWQAYDNIGALIAANAIWFGIFAVPTTLCFGLAPLGPAGRLALTVTVGLGTYALAASGVFALAARIARREEPAVRRFFGEARKFYPRVLGLSAIFGAVYLLLFHSIRFYGAIKVGGGVLGYFLAGIQLWILAFCLLMQVYLLPLLFLKDWSIRRTIRWSAMLVILRPGLTLLVFLQVFGLCVVLAITSIGIVLVLYSFAALFLSVGLLEVLREMESAWTPKTRPTSWKEIFAERDREKGEEAEDQRSLRDILKPWD